MAQILLIEDDRRIRLLLREMLELMGHEVFEATDGRHAFERGNVDSADVILTDIYMPGMEGVETIREILHRRPGAKVIAMSGGGAGLGANESLHVARLLGASHTLPKPFGQAQLQDALHRVLED